jgi:hypothetical protein
VVHSVDYLNVNKERINEILNSLTMNSDVLWNAMLFSLFEI